MSDGTSSPSALANKMTDSRYRRFSAAFGFGVGEIVQTGNRAGMETIVQQWRSSQFEIAVGEQDDTMRIALYAERQLDALATRATNDETKWFTIMGEPPLRALFETALGLPSAFARLDIDKQLEILRDRTRAVTGDSSVAQFAAQEKPRPADCALLCPILCRQSFRRIVPGLCGAVPVAGRLLVMHERASRPRVGQRAIGEPSLCKRHAAGCGADRNPHPAMDRRPFPC
ncbi:DUF1217 domain-containing protein [Jhaorihella thermophila]